MRRVYRNAHIALITTLLLAVVAFEVTASPSKSVGEMPSVQAILHAGDQ